MCKVWGFHSAQSPKGCTAPAGLTLLLWGAAQLPDIKTDQYGVRYVTTSGGNRVSPVCCTHPLHSRSCQRHFSLQALPLLCDSTSLPLVKGMR